MSTRAAIEARNSPSEAAMSRAVAAASPSVTRLPRPPKIANPDRADMARIPSPATSAGVRRVWVVGAGAWVKVVMRSGPR